MRRLYSTVRTIAIIAVVTLALDFVVTLFIPARDLDPWVRLREDDRTVYAFDTPLHHDLRPNVKFERTWGGKLYAFHSDQYGFRTGPCAGTDAVAEKNNTVFVIGDSFVEGLGFPFEQTVAGLLACAYRDKGLVVRNLGVASYSPIIYWRKIDDAAKRLALTPREIVVFLDISDIHNDGVDYREENGRIVGSVIADPPEASRRVKNFLKRNFTTFAIVAGLMDYSRHKKFDASSALNKPLSMWTVDQQRLEAYGRRGLETAAANLGRIVERCRAWNCRMSLVVYPWPDQIVNKDRDSIQVSYWRDWSAKNNVRFVDAFGPFFEKPAMETIEQNFLLGDIHLNAPGNRLLFDTVWKVLKD
jgi:hypothetical protein